MTYVEVPPSCAPFSEWRRVWEFLAPHGFGSLIQWQDGGFTLSPDLADGDGGYLVMRGNNIEWTRQCPVAAS